MSTVPTVDQKQPSQRQLIREAMNQFLEANVDRLRFRKKGENERLQAEFIQQTGHQITLNYLKDSVRLYRKQHGIELVNAANPYYSAKIKNQQ
jgi:hypothetical protein